MIEIKEVSASALKMEITDKILHALPNWFGVESSIKEYIQKCAKLPYWGVFNNDEPIGFLAGIAHNERHAEICVMGILEQYHRISIGRGLFNTFQNYCIKNGFRYVSVKTLDSSRPDKYYEATRKFYEAMGFVPFEVMPSFWNEENPCLILIKDLRDADSSYKCRFSEEINE